MQIEDYFDFVSPREIKLRGHRIWMEHVLDEYLLRDMTLEELVEQLTWAQLGRHKKPILILNIKGFWDPLCALLDHMRRLDFIRLELGVTLLVAQAPDEVLPLLRSAAARVSEGEKQGKPETVERM